MTTINIPHLKTPQHKKSALVDLGLYAISHGEWAMVATITRLIEKRGWSHA
jgi:hypothetical protein